MPTRMFVRSAGFAVFLAPILFGTLRLATTGSDARYLWTAAAGSVAAAATLLPVRSRPTPGRTAVAFVLATCGAAGAALWSGASSAGAIAAVTVAFGACSAGGLALILRTAAKA